MNKQNRKKQTERGITLIALVLMIVIVVILAAVTIRGLTGNEGIINVTEMAAIDYNVQSYREQVEQEVRSIIIAHSTVGEEATLEQIANNLREESLWVKDAVANTETTNPDILVTVTEGYTYQVYYNETYGTVFVEFVGQGDSFPSLESEFTKSKVTITSTASAGEGETIEKIELIYRGEVKETRGKDETQSGSVTFDVEKYGTGWYKLRTTASNGNVRYNWVRVATVNGRLTPPNISLEPEKPSSGWYNKSTEQVKVTITTENEGARLIHYSLGGVSLGEGKKENTETEHGDETGRREATEELTFNINKEGRSTITAWVTDDEGAESEIAREEVKIDKTEPSNVVLSAKGINGEEKNKNGWYKEEVEISVKAEDKLSGLAGYYVKKGNGNKEGTLKNIEDKIKITDEGTTKVTVYVADNAGNETEQNTEIKIDKQEPNTPQVTINEEGAHGFKVAVTANDTGEEGKQSGIDYVTIKIESTDATEANPKEITLTNDDEKKDFSKDTVIDELEANKIYSVTVVAYDRAGNSSTSESKQGHTKSILEAPTITITPEDGCKLCDSDWYDGNVRVKITDNEPESTATEIKYKVTDNGSVITNTQMPINGETHSIEFDIKKETYATDGEFIIDAWTSDGEEISKGNDEETFKRDTMNPEIPTVSIKDKSVSTTGFTVVVSAQDCTTCGTQSGIEKCEITVTTADGQQVTSKTINNENTDSNMTNKECGIDGLTPGVEYTIYAESTDRVGHTRTTRDTSSKLTQKTTQKLETPQIKFKQKDGQGPSDTQNGWYTGDVTVTIKDITEGSTATGIKYTITGIDGVNGEQTLPFNGESREVSFEISTTNKNGNNDGTHTINAWTADAGGKCESPAVGTLHIDTIAPLEPTVKLVEASLTSTGFSVTLENVKDGGEVGKASGVKECTIIIDGNGTQQNIKVTGDALNNTTTQHQFSGLVGGTTYTVYTETVDNAGLKTTSVTNRLQVITKDILKAPSVEIKEQNGTFLNCWYNGTVHVTIKDTASDSTANKIYYQINKSGTLQAMINNDIRSGGQVEFNIDQDGCYNITAWTGSGDTRSTCSGTNSFNRDGTPPVLKSFETTPNDLHSIKYNISAEDSGGSGLDCFKISANQLIDGNERQWGHYYCRIF